MKKALIGIAAGAMALGASVVPVSAYGANDNLWDVIQGGCVGGAAPDTISGDRKSVV